MTPLDSFAKKSILKEVGAMLNKLGHSFSLHGERLVTEAIPPILMDDYVDQLHERLPPNMKATKNTNNIQVTIQVGDFVEWQRDSLRTAIEGRKRKG